MTPIGSLRSDGFQVLKEVFSPEAVSSFRDAVSETIDRAAHAMRAPFSASCPELPIEERLDRVLSAD